jgi:hypothetical protein
LWGGLPFSQPVLEQGHMLVDSPEEGGVPQINLIADLIRCFSPCFRAVHGGENPGEHGAEQENLGNGVDSN